ncbi:MAG: aromatic ring-hydroxylating dioxygenase subunit alpha [Gammaproteobacteria bacterium]
MTAFALDRPWPLPASGCAVPYAVFTDDQVFAREQARIFRGPHWSFVGLAAEVPESGDFKATYVGAVPVILLRDRDGELVVLENRCAHRGALVCRELRGRHSRLACVYHQWTYDLHGRLLGVPFRGGIEGRGGMPADFDPAAHNLNRLRVACLHGLVFASFDASAAPLEDYLGEMVVASITRLCARPLKLLGDQRQFMRGNWKLYAENTRDPYHASLLHLFHTTFGLYRSSQQGATLMDPRHRHTMLYTKAATSSAAVDAKVYQDVRSYDTGFKLADPSLLAGRKEFDDGITLVILSVFPNLVLQQIANTLAVRQLCPRDAASFELVWTQFGYADDDADMDAIRLKQANLIGPAGFVSMEDGEAVEIVQRAVAEAGDAHSYVAMGGGRAEDAAHLVTESAIIGFWEAWREAMGVPEA